MRYVASYFILLYALVALVLLAGCGSHSPVACFEPVAVNPMARFAIIFDQCRGEVVYQTLPPEPLPRPGGYASGSE